MAAPFETSDTPTSVWLVIPVYNRCDVTRRCLAHLQAQGIQSWAQVLVIDDGSTDGTAEMLRESFAWVKVLTGDGGLWWTGAIRWGMEWAIQHGATCVGWLNDDSLPAPGSLAMIVELAVQQQAICGGVCRTADGAFVYAGGDMHRRWPRRLDPAPPPTAAPQAMEWLHGNLVAIPQAVWRRIGLPESRWMKHTFADIEYSLRAHRTGIPVLLVPAATGVADRNDTASYWSWKDARLTSGKLLAGFWNPKVWWYAPGLFYFKVSTGGLRGALDLAWVILKALMLGFFKCLPNVIDMKSQRQHRLAP